MSVATTPTPPAAPSAAPERRSPVRGILLGVAIGVVFVLVAVVVYAVTRPQEREADYLSPTSGSPAGSRALVAGLGAQGVAGDTATTLREVRELVDDPAQTTLLVFDYYLVLGSDQRRELLELADRVVVMEPWDDELADFAPGVVLGEGGDILGSRLETDCELPAAVQAEAVDAWATSYDVAEAENSVDGCFATGDDEFAVLQTRTRGADVTIVGISGAFTNGDILEAGNAAFALNLLGERENLVWYRPDLSELDAGDIPTAANRTAPWLTPLIILTLFAGLAAAIWRGRRLGPLVTERLPVVVRSNETMEGRARLYERAGARGHALDSLRIGSIARLASLCGLPRRASVDEVVGAVAALTGRDRDAVAELLVTRAPTSDSALVALSDELLVLESDLARILRGR
jgi:hypothetical protein